MFITVITDCHDSNALGRQSTRYASLFGLNPSFVSVSGSMDYSAELETAGDVIDCLDAGLGREGLIVFNVAPRGGHGALRENGSPFGYFKYGRTFVFGTIDGLVLPFLKNFGLLDEVFVSDLEQTMRLAVEEEIAGEGDLKKSLSTQFRSFDYLPFASCVLKKRGALPGKTEKVADLPKEFSGQIWKIDNFGNMKTSVLASDVKGGVLKTKWGDFRIYERMKDAPLGEVCAVVGSSGLDDKRFVEIIRRGENCAEALSARVGEKIFVI